jgi:DNA-binding NtrC family response regulator
MIVDSCTVLPDMDTCRGDSMPGRVLFVGGFAPEIARSVEDHCGCIIISRKNPAEAIAYAAAHPEVDAVLMSLRMPEMDGLDAMERIRAADSEIPVIISTGETRLHRVVDAMKRGAFNYIYEPDDPAELPFIMERALTFMKAIRENRRLHAAEKTAHEFIGISRAAAEVRDIIAKAAGSDLPVFITGESGTGKEIAARSLHRMSRRSSERFVAVNCGALSPALLEAELFGYVKGAFTGADRDRRGLFEQAHRGTLFLDEIGTTEPAFQVKLLRVLEEKKVRRVGGEEAHGIDARIIAASNTSPEQGIEQGTFRKDLFYRLNVIPLSIPPLRKHRDDIPVLARYFLDRLRADRSDAPSGFTPQALNVLERHSWPGNGRELRNVIERASLMCTASKIRVSDLPEEITLRTGISHITREHGLGRAVRNLEISLIMDMLEETGGNKAEAARRLALNRTTLVEKMKKLGIRYTEPEF